MYVRIKSPKDLSLQLGTHNILLAKDVEYVIPKYWEQSLGLTGETIDLNHLNLKRHNIENKKILFIRTMAYGDVLILTGIINYLKTKYPTCTIDFAVIKDHHELITKYYSHIIDNVLEMPFKYEELDKYDYVFTVTGLIEYNKENALRNIYDVYFDHLGLNPDEIEDVFKRPCNIDIKYKPKLDTIGIHPFSGSQSRTYNIHAIVDLCKHLIQKGFNTIWIFSNHSEFNQNFNFFKNIDPKQDYIRWSCTYGRTIADSVNHLVQCSKVICTDSSILHLCQAIGIPCKITFGPHHYLSRVKYYNNVEVYATNPDCMCFTHEQRCPKFFQYTPCMNTPLEFFLDEDLTIPNTFSRDIINF